MYYFGRAKKKSLLLFVMPWPPFLIRVVVIACSRLSDNGGDAKEKGTLSQFSGPDYLGARAWNRLWSLGLKNKARPIFRLLLDFGHPKKTLSTLAMICNVHPSSYRGDCLEPGEWPSVL